MTKHDDNLPETPEEPGQALETIPSPDRLRTTDAAKSAILETISDREDGVEIIDRRVAILSRLRKAAIASTEPEDWVLYRRTDKNTGAELSVTGYLQDAGCQRVVDIYGVSIFNVLKPEKIAGDDGSFAYLITGDGYCSVTGQTVEAIEGVRDSTEEFVRGKQGVRLETDVRKAARANLDGGIVRKLVGLKSIPVQVLAQVWGDSKSVDRCVKGRGFGVGADPEKSPACPVCSGPMDLRPAGTSKSSGKQYDAFWSCKKRECNGTRKS